MSGATEKTRLTLEKRHQLIDLNKEYVNFDIAFECRAVDATNDFEIIVVTQEQLNTVDITNLTMKRTKGGYISGNIIADEDKYQNYFLIMRSATGEPTEVDLEIRIKPIEPRTMPEQQPQPAFVAEPDAPAPDPFALTANDDVVCGGSSRGGKMVWMALVLLVVAGVVGYYFYKRRAHATTCTTEDDARSVVSSSSHRSSSSDESGILEALIQKSKK